MMVLFIIFAALMVTLIALTVTWGGLTNESDGSSATASRMRGAGSRATATEERSKTVRI